MENVCDASAESVRTVGSGISQATASSRIVCPVTNWLDAIRSAMKLTRSSFVAGFSPYRARRRSILAASGLCSSRLAIFRSGPLSLAASKRSQEPGDRGWRAVVRLAGPIPVCCPPCPVFLVPDLQRFAPPDHVDWSGWRPLLRLVASGGVAVGEGDPYSAVASFHRGRLEPREARTSVVLSPPNR